MKKILISVLVIASIVLSPLSAALAYNSSTAQTYLEAHAGSPWATMALSALNDASIPSDYLKNISGTSALDYEAPVLAITSLKKDPKTFGAVDYVAKIKSFASDGQLGDASTLNDDVFGILALTSSGLPADDQTISDSKNFLLTHQNQNGGWGFSTSAGSDSNTTASAIVALTAAGVPSSDAHIKTALSYLKTAQNSDGGFTYDPASQFGTDSDSSSTAWVLWALNSLNIDHSTWSKSGHNPDDYLQNNQQQSGYFSYQSGTPEDSFSPITTAYAVIALTNHTLPIHIFSGTDYSQTFGFRIEGSTDTVCTGQAQGPTALDVVKNASAQCGFTYHIKDSSIGSYLDKINDDQASGLTGWLYFVNNTSPDVGAADYQLKTGDDVLWYYGDFGWQPTRLTLDKTQISTSQNAVATVEYLNNGNWSALSGATVTVGTQTFATDNSGHATISNQDGFYQVFATKDGFVRSNHNLLQIGQPSQSSLGLSANIGGGGQVNGTSTQTTISFTVNQNSLDFGNLSTGQSAEKSVKLSNSGSSNLHLESLVSGDSLFMDGLSINSLPWQNFKVDLTSGQSQTDTVKLTVPKNYGSGGQKNGQLIFWASVE